MGGLSLGRNQPCVVSHKKNKGVLTHVVPGKGTCAEFTYPEEEVKDKE